MRRLLVIALLALPASVRATSLDEAVRLALANNRQIANANLEAGKASDRLTAVRTQRLPRVNFDVFSSVTLNRLTFDFREGIFGTYPGIGPVPAADTKVTLARTLDNFALLRVTQPLTQLRQVSIATRMAGNAAKAHAEDARDQTNRVVADVKRLYYSMQQTRAAMEAANAAVSTLREIEKIATRHFEEKTILRADLLDVQARLAAARATAATVTDAYALERERMALLVGAGSFTDPDPPRPVPENDEAPPQLARPDLAKAKLGIAIAEDDVRLERAKRTPDVSLIGSYVAPSTAGVLPKHIAAVTLTVSYEPFTWGRRAAEAAEKRKALEQARNTELDAQLAAAVEINDAHRRLSTARLSIAAREAERDAAEERLRIVRERFANEAALVKDVLERQAGATEAESRLIEATESYWIARADVERALGGDK